MIAYLYLNAYIYRSYIFKSSSISFIIKIIILNKINITRLYLVNNIYENQDDYYEITYVIIYNISSIRSHDINYIKSYNLS